MPSGGKASWEDRGGLLRVYAADWYGHEGFQKWIQAPGTATWHTGDDFDEYSDVFTWFSQGEGSDHPDLPEKPGIPEEIWKDIMFLVEAAIGKDKEVLLWISNF